MMRVAFKLKNWLMRFLSELSTVGAKSPKPAAKLGFSEAVRIASRPAIAEERGEITLLP